MAEFILVHGAFHGAWCWELVEPALRRLGHKSFAMDMPVDQPNVSIDDYADAVLSAVAGRAADDAYLVGHSLGGMVVPRVARHRPAARIILLCAGFTYRTEEERLENQTAVDMKSFYNWVQTDSLGRLFMSHENAIKAFFHDVQPDLADWAVGKLRPQWAEAMATVPPTDPYVERVAGLIDCADDAILFREAHRDLAFRRYGKMPIELPGSHSPFLSCPQALAETLDGVVRADKA